MLEMICRACEISKPVSEYMDKRQRPHAKHALTDRQIKYLAARIDGKTKTEAKRMAGYSENVSTSYVENREGVKKGLRAVMQAKGITADYLVDKMKNGLEAKKLVYATFEGQITDKLEVSDNETQFKHLKTALEVRGDLAEKNEINVDIGLVSMPQEAKIEEWNEK